MYVSDKYVWSSALFYHAELHVHEDVHAVHAMSTYIDPLEPHDHTRYFLTHSLLRSLKPNLVIHACVAHQVQRMRLLRPTVREEANANTHAYLEQG